MRLTFLLTLSFKLFCQMIVLLLLPHFQAVITVVVLWVLLPLCSSIATAAAVLVMTDHVGGHMLFISILVFWVV